MTDKELKRLSRGELLELLLAQMKESERLKRELELAQRQLADRTLRVEQAGSIAEAALQLSGIFDAAQAAADQYLENIQRLSGEQAHTQQELEAQARQKADEIIAEAETYSQRWRSQADAYWEKIHMQALGLLQGQKDLRSFIEAGIGAPYEAEGE